MRAYLTSGSKLAILPSCAYYARPDVPWHEDSPGEPARFGSAVHALCDAFLSDRPLTVYDAAKAHGAADVERVQRVWSKALAWLSDNRLVGWLSEMPLAYNWREDTARELPRGKHRDYSAIDKTMEIPLTVDAVSMRDDCAIVYDWKTGRADLASYEMQAKASALAWARLTGASSAVARFVRFTEDAEPEVYEWRFDAMDLDHIADGLGQQLAAAAELRAEPRPGAHCSEAYCPARASCPATTAVMRSNPQIAPLEELVSKAITTPEAAGQAYVKLRVIKDAVKAVEEQIRAIVERDGFAPTSGGKGLRLVSSTSERFAKSRCPSELLEALRDAGAMETSTSMVLREVKAS